MKQLSQELTQSQNYLQPLEVLGCHSVAECLLSSPELVSKLQTSAFENSKPTLFEQFIEDKENKEQIQEQFREVGDFLGQKWEMFSDFSLRNAMTACMDFSSPMAMVATLNQLVDYVVSQPPNANHRHMLMGLFPSILRR